MRTDTLPADVDRRECLRRLGALAAAGLVGTEARAAAYPDKPVRLIVAAPPASGPDAISRMLAGKLTEQWKQPIVIDNITGVGGVVGTERAAKAPADGHTLLVSVIGAMAVSGSLLDRLPYDPVKDFAPVSLLITLPNLLAVHPAVPARSLAELIAYAKANPGKLRYGHPGSGTSPHLAAELFSAMAGVQMLSVPYKSSGQMTTDLLAGHVDLLFHNASVMLPFMKTGAARVLAITSAQRSPLAPQVPTLAEAGLPGYEVTAWYALYAPARTPPDIVARLNADVSAVLAMPDVKAWIENQPGMPGGGTPEALASFQAGETRKWRSLIQAAHIKAD